MKVLFGGTYKRASPKDPRKNWVLLGGHLLGVSQRDAGDDKKKKVMSSPRGLLNFISFGNS